MGGQLIRCVAIDVSSSKYGFAVLEGSLRLVEWGQRRLIYRRLKGLTKSFDALADRFRPDLLIVRRYRNHGSRQARHAVEVLTDHALESDVGIRKVSLSDLQRAFSGVDPFTKHEVAIAVSNMFPELSERLPRRRKRWEKEDERHSLFQAVAIGFTALAEEERDQMRQ